MHTPRWAGRLVSIGGRVAVAVVLLWLILSRVDLRKVGAAFGALAPGLAVAACAVMLLVGIVTGAKWLVLLRALDIPVTAATALRLTYIAVTWNLVLPGGESGNLVKAALLARQRPGMAGAVWASMLVDQVALAAAQSIVAVVTLLLATRQPDNLFVWLIAAGIILVGVSLIYAAFLLPIATQRVDAFMAHLSHWLAVPAWLRRRSAARDAGVAATPAVPDPAIPPHAPGEWLEPLWLGLTRYRGHVGSIVASIGLAILYYAVIFLAYWLAARGLGIAFSYADIAWVTAFAGIAALLPITIAGAGVREGVITVFLTAHGVAPSLALAFSFAVFALQVVLGIPGVILQFAGGRERTQMSTDRR